MLQRLWLCPGRARTANWRMRRWLGPGAASILDFPIEEGEKISAFFSAESSPRLLWRFVGWSQTRYIDVQPGVLASKKVSCPLGAGVICAIKHAAEPLSLRSGEKKGITRERTALPFRVELSAEDISDGGKSGEFVHNGRSCQADSRTGQTRQMATYPSQMGKVPSYASRTVEDWETWNEKVEHDVPAGEDGHQDCNGGFDSSAFPSCDLELLRERIDTQVFGRHCQKRCRAEQISLSRSERRYWQFVWRSGRQEGNCASSELSFLFIVAEFESSDISAFDFQVSDNQLLGWDQVVAVRPEHVHTSFQWSSSESMTLSLLISAFSISRCGGKNAHRVRPFDMHTPARAVTGGVTEMRPRGRRGPVCDNPSAISNHKHSDLSEDRSFAWNSEWQEHVRLAVVSVWCKFSVRKFNFFFHDLSAPLTFFRWWCQVTTRQATILLEEGWGGGGGRGACQNVAKKQIWAGVNTQRETFVNQFYPRAQRQAQGRNNKKRKQSLFLGFLFGEQLNNLHQHQLHDVNFSTRKLELSLSVHPSFQDRSYYAFTFVFCH